MAHLNSYLLWHQYAEAYFTEGKNILEIGPAGYPTYYEKKLTEHNIAVQYQVLDVRKNFISGAEQHPNFILAADPLHYPFGDDHFDIVFSDQVMAHVEYFWAWYGELRRITKPGGYIITINSYSYPSCPSPIDAWRIHSDGMRSLNNFYGLETVLCLTASLEMEQFKIPAKTGYYFPGASIRQPFGGHSDKNLRISLLKRNWNNLVGRIPKLRALLLNPVQVSFDTITVARKG